MDSALADIRFAIRQLLKHKAFTVIAVLTLALGIGANTAVFSVVYGVLLKPLPYPEPARIVGVAESGRGYHYQMSVTYHEFEFLAQRAPGLEAFAAYTNVGMNLTASGAGDHLRGLRVSRDYFKVLRVAPMIGREFAAEEDAPAGPVAVILSYDLWQRRFGADRAIVGRAVEIDGATATVIGVMPAGFQSLPVADIWSTIAQVGRTVGSGENIGVIGRLSPNVSVSQANARAEIPFADFRREFKQMGLPADLQMSFAPYNDLVVNDVQTPVKVLFGAIGFVLLIACANVASLLLGRAALRSREVAVRIALGASRGRIIRQMLTESLLLALVGGVAAIAVATWGLRALLTMVPGQVPHTGDVHLDGYAMAFTLAVALGTGVFFGLVPAWLTARSDPNSTINASTVRSTSSSGQSRLRNILVTAEMALALILLSGAGLMIRTVANLMHTESGFDVGHVLSAEIWLSGSRYQTSTAIAGFYHELTTRLVATPGVAAAAVVEAGMPLERGGNIGIWSHGERLRGGTDYRTVTPGYFRTLGVNVGEGRDFRDADDAAGAPVVIVNRSFARRYFPNGAIGQTITVGNDSAQRTILGVVGDIKSYVGFDAPAIVFVPSAQTPIRLTQLFSGWFPIHVMVRTTGDPAASVTAVRRTIEATDAEVPVGLVRTMADVLGTSLALQRFVMVLLSVFAGLAVMLAMIGIYGLISWFVVRSTREIGVRIALGALPRSIMGLVVRRGMSLAVTGAALGIAGSIALTRLLEGLLYEVRPADPWTLAGVTLALCLVAALGCLLPARRATRVDPIVSLRSE